MVVGPRDKIPEDSLVLNVTSHATNSCKLFSPMILGPVVLPDGRISKTMENAWQYSKVYAQHIDPDLGLPNEDWRTWSNNGMSKSKAERYPMGKGARPEYSWDGTRKLDYITARRELYFPLYRDAVAKTDTWKRFQEQFAKLDGKRVVIFDFDGYDMSKTGQNLSEVLNNPNKIMGHGFVFMAMLLHGDKITPDEIDSIYRTTSPQP